jgi:uncharacterized membrane protein
MSERTLRLASAALATVGVAITGYLLYVRESGGELVCSTGGCETVQNSPYAEVLGVPVAALALAGFVGLFAAALARGEWARLTQATLALSAFLFSAYLLYIQVAVIDAICQWCLGTDVITTAIAALALLRLRVGAPLPPKAVPVSPRPNRRPAERRGAKRKKTSKHRVRSQRR